MAQYVRERQESLESENTTLENTVKERTIELERLLEEARINANNRHHLLADVSHELRTPLTIIRGESDIALRGQGTTSEEYREALRRAKVAAEHTAAIVDDLLLISRQESGNLRLKTEVADAVGIVRDAVSLSPVQAEFDTKIESIPVTVDKLRIRQALLALLQNAKVHGATAVRIEIAANETACHLTIADNGPGMTLTEKQSAFTRFYRGANTRAGYDEGYGLGLPIVKSVIDAHGGTVTLQDSELGGLAVVLSIPLRVSLRAVS